MYAMRTSLKVFVAVMLVLSCSVAFAEGYPDQDNDVLSATDAMGFYYGGKSMCSKSALESLSYDTIKSKVRKVRCRPAGCYIQLKSIFKDWLGPRDIWHYDFTDISGIICPDVIDEFDIQFLENKIEGKKVKIKGLIRKTSTNYGNEIFRDIFIFIRSPEDIEIMDGD